MKSRAVIFLFLLAACQDPTSSIRPDIEAFKAETPNNFYFAQVGGRQVRAAWAGRSTLRPLIFVHGSPGSWQGWAAFLRNEELKKSFHIIAVDRLGYGGSGSGKAERSLAVQAQAISQILRKNESGLGAIVVGHSMGGPIAARVAIDFPAQVSGLVLLSSSVDPDLEETKWIQVPAQWLLLKWMIPSDLIVCNEEILALRAELQGMLGGWSRIDQPMAVVHGDDDDLVPVANVDFLKRHLTPGVLINVEIMPGVNHFIPWLKPESVLNAIGAVKAAVAHRP